jgi:hypothetical protein
MPRRSKGARLWLEPARRDKKGTLLRRAVFVIRDGTTKRSTGFGEGQIEQAQRALAEYIANKYRAPRVNQLDPAAVKVADVISIYAEDVAHKHARPQETAARLGRILDFFSDTTLAHINRKACDDYVRQRGAQAAARRELEDLRAAIRHHWEAGLCAALTPVVLPERGQARERWLTRNEGGAASMGGMAAAAAMARSAKWQGDGAARGEVYPRGAVHGYAGRCDLWSGIDADDWSRLCRSGCRRVLSTCRRR